MQSYGPPRTAHHTSVDDRVEVTGLRPLPLPHHRTCGLPHPAVEPSGFNLPQDPMEHINLSLPSDLHSAPSCFLIRSWPRSPPAVSPPAGIHRRSVPPPTRIVAAVATSVRFGRLFASPQRLLEWSVSWSFGPSLHTVSRASWLLWPLLTPPRLSSGRSPRVRHQDCRLASPDSTSCVFR
jgi:hypothetical protein